MVFEGENAIKRKFGKLANNWVKKIFFLLLPHVFLALQWYHLQLGVCKEIRNVGEKQLKTLSRLLYYVC